MVNYPQSCKANYNIAAVTRGPRCLVGSRRRGLARSPASDGAALALGSIGELRGLRPTNLAAPFRLRDSVIGPARRPARIARLGDQTRRFR